jgi:hypothetical protein
MNAPKEKIEKLLKIKQHDRATLPEINFLAKTTGNA